MVDIPRPGAARRRRIRRLAAAAATVAVVSLITVVVSGLRPAAPSVDRATLWPDTVQRGSMIRQVRGTGTLVPEEIRWIPAETQGRVERILMRPGASVTPDSILLELSNPELEQTVLEAELSLKAAEARYENRRAELESALLNQRAATAQVEAAFREATLQADADEELAGQGLVSDLTRKISQSKARELEARFKIEEQRLAITAESVASQSAPERADVDRLRTLYELRRKQRDALKVRAGTTGVLQLVPVDVGQQVSPGTNLARVADPTELKAELRIAETQAKDVQIGQPALVDTRNGVVAGRVVRIDPAVQQGTVTVDVTLEGPLPRGARPDLSVDGTIELERLEDILYVGRPAFGQENSLVSLFKVTEQGREAHRVRVQFGRSSVNHIEIVEGLQVGDQVILSDMSAWDAYDRVRLN
jgi:HlyD family secretion protein